MRGALGGWLASREGDPVDALARGTGQLAIVDVAFLDLGVEVRAQAAIIPEDIARTLAAAHLAPVMRFRHHDRSR